MDLLDKLDSREMPGKTRQREIGTEGARGTYLTGTGRDLRGLDDDERAVKFHVPEPVRVALDELAAYHDNSLSALVRHVMFVHVYGHYELFARAERGHRRYMPQGDAEPPGDVPMFSRAADAENRTAGLGKSDRDIKVWVAAALADELDRLARAAGISRSEYIREMLVTHLFGRSLLPDRR